MSLPRRICAFLLLTILLVPAHADEAAWQGRSVRSYIDWLNTQGLAIVYSSDLVDDAFTVLEEPGSGNAVDALRAVLEPYSLTLSGGPGDSLLVVRDGTRPEPAPVPDAPIEAPTPLQEIIVTSSRYSLDYERSGSHTFLDRELATRLPDIGDEAVRAVARLPGVAGGGVSTRNHVRGGAANEQLFLFDGLRLYEPYHLKDFQSLSTIIDPNAIASIDFYSAGYQARYGDRMSGVIDIAMRQPAAGTMTEIGVSAFNTHALSMGRYGGGSRGDWLVTARRGNLDVLADAVNPDYGSPRYADTLWHAGWELSERTRLGANFLYSNDEISIADPHAGEDASAGYRNRVLWFKAETDWSSRVSTSSILSATKIENSRTGVSDVPDVSSGNVADQRGFRSLAFQQDWRIGLSDRWFIATGYDVKRLEADYRYDSALQIFPPFDQILDNQPVETRSIRTSPRGSQYAVYLEARWRMSDELVLDTGLRWDQQTYTTSSTEEQVSPRFNLLWYASENTELRFGYGTYYQGQEINELQIAGGEASFHPAQRATHFIASMTQHTDSGLDIRVEAYRKEYESLMPRFENSFDPLILIPELQIDRARIDAAQAVSRGAELTLSGENARSTLLWWLSYSWAVTKDLLPEGRVRRSWDQSHMGQAGLSWDWKFWSFSVAGTVHTGWPKTELEVDSVANPDGSVTLLATTTPRNSLRHAPFHSLDARVSRRFGLSKGELTAFLEITNLYNRKNPCCTTYRMGADVNGAPGLLRDEGNWLPLVPSIGVVWQF